MQEPREMWVWSLGQEDCLEKEMATHSSILAWEIPWTEEPGLPSMRLRRAGHGWTTKQQIPPFAKSQFSDKEYVGQMYSHLARALSPLILSNAEMPLDSGQHPSGSCTTDTASRWFQPVPWHNYDDMMVSLKFLSPYFTLL